MSQQTRYLAGFIAAGYWVEGENPAIAEAGSIAFDDLESAMLSNPRARPDKPKPEAPADGKPGPPKEGDSYFPPGFIEPKAGSFERLSKMFGIPG